MAININFHWNSLNYQQNSTFKYLHYFIRVSLSQVRYSAYTRESTCLHLNTKRSTKRACFFSCVCILCASKKEKLWTYLIIIINSWRTFFWKCNFYVLSPIFPVQEKTDTILLLLITIIIAISLYACIIGFYVVCMYLASNIKKAGRLTCV